jgi:hypothetical protein
VCSYANVEAVDARNFENVRDLVRDGRLVATVKEAFHASHNSIRAANESSANA